MHFLTNKLAASIEHEQCQLCIFANSGIDLRQLGTLTKFTQDDPDNISAVINGYIADYS